MQMHVHWVVNAFSKYTEPFWCMSLASMHMGCNSRSQTQYEQQSSSESGASDNVFGV